MRNYITLINILIIVFCFLFFIQCKKIDEKIEQSIDLTNPVKSAINRSKIYYNSKILFDKTKANSRNDEDILRLQWDSASVVLSFTGDTSMIFVPAITFTENKGFRKVVFLNETSTTRSFLMSVFPTPEYINLNNTTISQKDFEGSVYFDGDDGKSNGKIIFTKDSVFSFFPIENDMFATNRCRTCFFSFMNLVNMVPDHGGGLDDCIWDPKCPKFGKTAGQKIANYFEDIFDNIYKQLSKRKNSESNLGGSIPVWIFYGSGNGNTTGGIGSGGGSSGGNGSGGKIKSNMPLDGIIGKLELLFEREEDVYCVAEMCSKLKLTIGEVNWLAKMQNSLILNQICGSLTTSEQKIKAIEKIRKAEKIQKLLDLTPDQLRKIIADDELLDYIEELLDNGNLLDACDNKITTNEIVKKVITNLSNNPTKNDFSNKANTDYNIIQIAPSLHSNCPFLDCLYKKAIKDGFDSDLLCQLTSQSKSHGKIKLFIVAQKFTGAEAIVYAKTTPFLGGPTDNVIYLYINSTYCGGINKIDQLETLQHELIHAKIKKILFEEYDWNGGANESFVESFKKLVQSKYGYSASVSEHDLMLRVFLDPMVNSLLKINNNIGTYDDYLALVLGGLGKDVLISCGYNIPAVTAQYENSLAFFSIPSNINSKLNECP
ncbi:MAG: hypothetical protein ACOYOA_11505 [Saprospiraceae bacterium]